MSDFNEELIKEINLLRKNPKEYANKISKYLKYFNEKIFCYPGNNIQIQTEEGVEAFKEAIDFLNEQKEKDPLIPSKGLFKIADEYLSRYLKPNTEELSDEDMEKIINKYGKYYGYFFRAIDFGGETPEMVVIDLIVSDGDSLRKQRESLLNNEIIKIGIANRKHEIYGHCSSIITCTEFENTLDKNDEEILIKKEEKKEEIKIIRKPLAVTSIDKSEKIIVEDGDKKKETKITKVMEDGSKQIAIIKEIFDD